DECTPGNSNGRWSRRRQRSLVYFETSAAGGGSHAPHVVGRLVPAPRADRAGLDTCPGRQGSGPSAVSDPQGGRANSRREATLGVNHPGSTASTGCRNNSSPSRSGGGGPGRIRALTRRLMATRKAAGGVLTAKQAPHRPGTAPALGLRA